MDKKFWNNKAGDYDRLVHRFFADAYRTITEYVIRDAARSENVLDAAGGTGMLTIPLSACVSHITALDLSSEMQQVAREKINRLNLHNIDLVKGNIHHLEFGDETFDTIVAANVLHLLPESEHALQEIRRVLRGDGRIIVPTFCHGANLRSRILTVVLSLLGQRPANCWSPEGFRKFVEAGGFSIIKEQYVDANIPLLYLVAAKR